MADIPDYGDPKDVKEAVQRTHVPGMSEAIRQAGLEPQRGDVSPVFERATNQVISEVEQARQRRRAEFLKRQDASMASPRSRGDAIVAAHMPEGGRIVRHAQNVQLGGGNSGNLYTAPIPYNYPYESPERDWYPESRTVQVKVSRQVAADNGLIATCMDILSELPYSEFDLKGDGIDGSVKRAYEEMVDRTSLVNMCQTATRELYITGEAPLHGLWDSTHGMWRRFHIHPSDQLTVYDMPVLMNEPIVEWTPPVSYKQLLNIDHPQMRKNRLAIPPDVLRAVENGESITLEPAAFTLIARKNSPDCARGTSILTRLWRAIVYEDAIFHAAIQTARRMACFVAGTPILTVAGVKNIEDITPGEKVIAGNGKVEIVEGCWAQKPNGSGIVEIEALGTETLRCTLTHKFKVWSRPTACACGCGQELEPVYTRPDGMTRTRKSAYVNGHHLRELRNAKGQMSAGATTGWKVCCEQPQLRVPTWHEPIQTKEAWQLRPGDFFVIPRKFEPIETAVSPEAARVLGYFVAEGSERIRITEKKEWTGVSFTFSLDEAETWARDVVDAAKKAADVDALHHRYVPGAETKMAKSGRVGRTTVYIQRQKDEPFAQWLCDNGGIGANYHVLSEEVMRWPLELKRELIRGYFRGDGHWGFIDGCAQVCAGTTSKTLAYQIRLILAQLGYFGSISPNPRKGIEGQENWADTWIVSSTGRDARALADLIWGVEIAVPDNASTNRTWSDDEFVYVPIQKVKHTYEDVVTYNLSVSGDKSYVSAGIQTYNSPIKIAKLGDPGSDYFPTEDQERALKEALAQAELDVGAWITWSWAINFELVGVQERVLPITQHMPLVEQMILSAFGINKALILGEASYNSASAGLTIILQRLLAMRNLFTKKWLIPKVFGMMAVANDWVLRSPAEIQHGLRIKRSPQETKYIIPDIVWRKSLDSNIDSEKIQAMAALRDLGARYSQKSLHTLSGTDFQEETDQIIRETKYRRQAAGADAGLLAALGGGEENAPGGGGGGMIGSPGIAPPVGGGGGGAEAPPDMGGAVPPDMGGGEPAPGGDTGAPPADGAQAAGPRGKPQPTQPSGDKEHGLPKEFIEAGVRFLATLNPEEARDVAPWDEILEDPMVKEAMDSQDPGEVWDAVETSFAEMGLPPQAIAAISDTLTSRAKKLAKAAYAGQRRIARTGKRPLVTMHENTTKVLQMVNRNKLQREIQELDATAGIDLYTGSSD